jgi:hypothetical protein
VDAGGEERIVRRTQLQQKAHTRKEDPGRVLPIDPRDQDVLRAKQLRRSEDLAARQTR